MAWNSYPGSKLSVDGAFGKPTIFALQYFLKYKSGGLYQSSNDGELGYYTALALQYFVKNKGFYTRNVDGNAGNYTWDALENYIDSLPGHSLTCPPMPWPDATMTRGIQRWLNSVR